MKFPTTPHFGGDSIFNSRRDLPSNPSVLPPCVTAVEKLANSKKVSDSITKATAVRKGAAALAELKDRSVPVGFTGTIHPLSQTAESATTASLANDDPETHDIAAEAHEAAAKKMASFMKETSPKKHSDHLIKMRGLTATRDHHLKEAKAHRDRAVYLRYQEEVKEREEKADAEAKKKAKAKAKK